MLLGGLLGGFFSAGFVFAQTIVKGIPASKDHLELSGVHVSGVMAKNREENLHTLRRFIAYLAPRLSGKSSQTLALIKGKGRDYSQDIAALLSKQGFSVMLLDLTFEKTEASQQQPSGLLQYLEGEASFPTISHQERWDSIDSGGFCHFSHERLGSQKFLHLIDDLKSRYDWVIGITNVLPNEPEAENFIHLFDHAVVTIHQETQKDLKPVIQLALNVSPEKKVSFVISK